jgi:hypothetical protein
MSTTPAGWYPDPDAPTRLRYWDGSQWTEHFSEPAPEPVLEPVPEPVPATPTTPAGWYPDPSGAPGRRYWDGAGWTDHFAKDAILDVELRRPMRKKSDRVVLTDQRLTKGDEESVDLDTAEHVAYWVMVHDGGAFHGTKAFHFRLWGAAGDVNLDFGVLPSAYELVALHERAFETLIAASREHVEPRLRAAALARIESGETVEIGGIDASAAGLANGRKTVSWSDYGEIKFEYDYLRVRNRAGKEVLKGTGGTDGPLASAFFVACAERFG